MKKMCKITLIMLLLVFFSASSYAMKMTDASLDLSPKSNQEELEKIAKIAYQCECAKKVLVSFKQENKEVNEAMATGSVKYLDELVRAYKQESTNSYNKGDIPGGVYYH
ncbi:MAG: hypothetical protein WA055_01960 [Candidatus Moraniibacteriota bacterium]